MPAELHVLRGVQFGERFELPDGTTAVIGRDTDLPVRLIGAQVSRRHFEIQRGGEGAFRIRDLGSGNGTYVNGRRVGEATLADGDRIACGDVECRFVASGAAAPDRTILHLTAEVSAAATVEAEWPADGLAHGGLAGLDPVVCLELAAACARETAADRLCHQVLDICRRAALAERGAVLRAGPDGVFVPVAVQRGPADPAALHRPLRTALLERVTRERTTVTLRLTGPPAEAVLLVPIPVLTPTVLYLGRAAAAGAFDEARAAAVTAAAAILGRALERVIEPREDDTRTVQMRLLLEGSDDCFFVLDEDGRVTYLNHAPGAAAGDMGGLLGRRLLDLAPMGDREDLLQALDRVLEGDARTVVETELQLPDGGALPVRLHLSPLRNRNGAVVGVAGVARDQREVQALRRASEGEPSTREAQPVPRAGPPGTEAIVGISAAIRTVVAQVGRVALQAYPVLVVGETGTGKEMFARAIHAGSPRSSRTFVPVNCAALPDNLLEAELFGHIRGAFTGAHRSRRGLIATADGGSLFLDEVGEMGPAMQARLLRVLEDGEVRPVGEDRGQRVDVRIIAATHRDLDALVHQGRFRQDLLYRLDVVRVQLPPLRERVDDIPLLVDHALRLVAGETGVRRDMGPDALAALARYRWPGNVRELLNVIRRAAVGATGEVLTLADLPPALRSADLPADAPRMSEPRTLREIERQAILDAIAACGGNRKRAAGMLGMPRATFYRRLHVYGLLSGDPADDA